MAVIATDVKYKLSGGAANAAPAAALGGVRSTADIVTGSQNLFDDVAPAEATSGDVEYRCFYVFNDNDADTLNAVKVWLAGDTPSPGTVAALGLDPAGVGDGTTTGVAAVIANEQTAPAGVVFSAALDEASSLAIGNLGPNQGRAVWMRRTVSAGAQNYSGDGAVIRVRGTPA